MKKTRVWFAVLVLAPLACSPAEPARPKSTKDNAPEAQVKFEDVRVGTGAEAKSGDYVVVHYTGWLTNETKFDSSVDRQEPFRFRLGHGEVIKGWDKGVVGMKEGGKRRLTIPPELAYGKSGSGRSIPADATLIFEIDLLKVQ